MPGRRDNDLMRIKTTVGVVALIFLIFSMPLATASKSISLPIHSITPGATNPAVTQSDVQSTICKSGWTATIRPSSSYTTRLKEQELAGTYSGDTSKVTGRYEEDHLISLELGGNPTSILNLWPEPYAGHLGARVKDKLENKLKGLVCAGAVSLKVAQAAIAKNWYLAYKKYVLGVTASVPTSTPTPIASVASVPTATPVRPSGATAICKDGTYSYSPTHGGSCSRHGGVLQFYS